MNGHEGQTERVLVAKYGSTSFVEGQTVGVNGRTLIPGEQSVAFVNINYAVATGMRLLKKPKKGILNSASGLMLPGLNAIMGPTGSGKTTLLDILAERKASKGLTGTVLINGRTRPKNFRWLAGYVVQENTVMGTLTVRENLTFSAALRLPSHITKEQRKERVQKVINDLGLQGCADQMIGTAFIRGVSGGEKKRTNIGMELIIEPQVLFLDEPTTGLDAHTAVSVVKVLKDLSQSSGRIVIMSIHQPRYSIFKLFDTLTLLSGGDLVYHGPTTHCVDYFGRIGFPCNEGDNPADFVLDVIMHCEETDRKQTPEVADAEVAAVPLLTRTTPDLVSSFLHSEEYQTLMDTVQPMVEATNAGFESAISEKQPSLTYATSFFWQFAVLCTKSLGNVIRDPTAFIIQIIVNIVFAMLVGGIYFQRPNTPQGLEDRIGVIFLLVMSVVFGNLGAIEVFIAERAVFLHENASGYYRVSAFFLAKVLTDIVLLRIIPMIPFCIITYLMIGFQAQFDKFLIYYLTLSLTSVSGTTIALAFSALVSTFDVANMLVAFVFSFSMVFGGFFLGLSSLPSWIGWLQYFSLFRFTSEALTINEIYNQVYNGTDDSLLCPYKVVDQYCVAYGNEILEFRGYNVDWLWMDEFALALTSIFWMSLAYIILRGIRVYYRYYH